MNNSHFVDDLKKIQVSIEATDYKKRGYDFDLQFNASCVREFANIMLKYEYYLVFVTAIHVKPCIQIVYQFAHFSNKCRISARTLYKDNDGVHTISDIFHGANWHEREIRDFFGITFINHPNLEPLLLADEDKDYHPLLKNDKSLKTLDSIFKKTTDELVKTEKAKEKKKDGNE